MTLKELKNRLKELGVIFTPEQEKAIRNGFNLNKLFIHSPINSSKEKIISSLEDKSNGFYIFHGNGDINKNSPIENEQFLGLYIWNSPEAHIIVAYS